MASLHSPLNVTVPTQFRIVHVEGSHLQKQKPQKSLDVKLLSLLHGDKADENDINSTSLERERERGGEKRKKSSGSLYRAGTIPHPQKKSDPKMLEPLWLPGLAGSPQVDRSRSLPLSLSPSLPRPLTRRTPYDSIRSCSLTR